MFTPTLKKIISGKDLSEQEMAAMMTEIFSGSISNSQISAFMAALATKGETFEELAGAARAMRRKALKLQAPGTTVVDTCGTGGDELNTFNISTTTAFVVAACGVTVAKHGNRSVSSQCGSADLLEALGVKLDTDPEIVEEALNEVGIGFLYAPLYHGAMRFAAKARKEFGLRSIFNMLGPLTNPAGATCQLLGVYSSRLTEMFAQALKALGTRRAFVVHGHEGLDEISICGPTRISELNDQMVRTYDITPEQFGMQTAKPHTLVGGDAQANARITHHIFKGQGGPQRDIVVLNAAAALVAAGKKDQFEAAIEKASSAIDSGRATEKLEALISFTQENG